MITFSKPMIRLSFPIDYKGDIKGKMREKGLYADPNAEKDIPHTTKKGLVERNLVDLTEDLSICKIYIPRKKDIKKIDGKGLFPSGDFFVTQEEAPQIYKRVPSNKKDYVDADNKYWGEIKTIDINTGDVVRFGPVNFASDSQAQAKKQALIDIFNQIESQSITVSQELVKKTNAAIKEFNARMDKIDAAAASLANIPLQIGRTQKQIEIRIADLNGQIEYFEETLKQPKPSPISDLETHLEQQLGSGAMSKKHFVDTILSRYINKYDKMVEDLKSGKIVVPSSIPDAEAFKQKLINLGEYAFEQYLDNIKKQKEKEEAAPTREFDITKYEESPLTEITTEDIKHQTKAREYAGYKGYIQWFKRALEGSKKDRTQLQAMLAGLEQVRQTIAVLPDKSNDFCKTEQGKQILDLLKDLCNEKLKVFVERYARDIVNEEGKPDKSKYGSEGTAGNNFVTIALLRLYKVISTLFKNLGLTIPPPNKLEKFVEPAKEAITGTEAPISTPVASEKIKIKISNSEWKKWYKG